MSESLSLKMGILPQHFRSTKQLSFQLQDRDSSSTGQSCPEAASAGDSNIYGQSLISPSSGVNGIHGKHAESRTKLASLAGTQDYAVPPPLVDYSKSIASFYMCSLVGTPSGLCYAWLDKKCFLFVIRLCDICRCIPSRFIMLVTVFGCHWILKKMNQYRAELEAQNKLIKVRKMLLWPPLALMSQVPPNSDEMFQQPDLRFSGYSPDYRGHAGNIHGDGNLHHLSGLS
ncbi:hypothetical protein V6N11_030125 [Hibiscus sabdariffa]|uniref:Uncharacterized protein n=1 Tax=Hibiscus sabdariffa TaxID=183260 RepID=A0ABR2PK01_9ROSI